MSRITLAFVVIVARPIFAPVLISCPTLSTWYDVVGKKLPCDSPVVVGWTEEGRDIFAGRAWHKGNLLPGAVIDGVGGIFVGLNGEERFLTRYSVMCEGKPIWVPASNGEVPDCAISAGHTTQGEHVYYGRVILGKAALPGKIVPSEEGILIPLDGKELFFKNYQVMTFQGRGSYEVH